MQSNSIDLNCVSCFLGVQLEFTGGPKLKSGHSLSNRSTSPQPGNVGQQRHTLPVMICKVM